MRRVFNWKQILFINTVFFPDTFVSVVEVLFFSIYLKLSFADFSFIFAFCLFISIFLQIPTGYISDKFGRKLMLLFGSLIDILGIIATILLPQIVNGNLFLPVLTIEVVRTSMKVLANGNFDVLIFEMFKETKSSEDEFMKESSSFFSTGAIVAAISGLISTILFSYWVILPLMVDLIIKIIQLLSNFFITELPNGTFEKYQKKEKKFILPSFQFDKKLILLLGVLALLFTVSRGTFSLYQPIMTSLDIPLVYYGVMIMIINFSVFFLLKVVKKYMKKNTIYNLLGVVILVLFSQTIIILSTFTNNIIFRFLIISFVFSAMQITRLISEGLSSYFINIEIKDKKNKTTIFSGYSMIANILLSALFFMMGFLQRIPLSYMTIYCIVSIVMACILLFLKLKEGVT
ncbi:MAG: MFS transporter [Lactococcus lactis]